MPVIPVQYESLKAILPYMNPNTRFQISLRIPSVSSLESRIPLKVENLTFAGPFTEVNKVSFDLAVYRDYGRNETPPDVVRMNQRDDIDQYGVIIYPGLNNVLPGDIDFRTTVQEDVPVYTEEWEQGLVQQLRILKMLLAERLNEEYIEDDETRNAGVDGPVNAFNETFRQSILNHSVEFIQLKIQSLRDQLSGYTNRRNNQNRPYTPWIQFTTRSPKGVTIQRVAYNKYLYEARKTVHTKLFGNRDSSISVKNLKIELHDHILRFPAGTILKIENLEVAFWKSLAFERFKKIIHPSSLPIRRLKVSSSVLSADLRHTIAREAKYLIINNLTSDNRSWTPILQSLTNERVCLMNENNRNPPNNYMDLIENWLERGRPAETCFYIGIKKKETVKQCLDTLRQRQEVIGSFEKKVQLRIDAALMLEVSYDITKRHGRFLREDESNWWLKLAVVPGRFD
ncbi:hypothetical protein GCK72_004374 [Caenorhabditis remanei]|uniref:F-box C protein n=1 Tax=Caenorhabditis remanei TaxID=31234 RepID=A0A6A5HC63_CAERE|nr:hypothetical protein GCK72_004374 [Caenorhabditis remanei]KAF1764426.1 hypothetical protein GCK72_004374 [Caenorhabditis remanei]